MKASGFHRAIRWLVWAGALILAALLAFALFRPAPQDLPWTPLSLDQPIGLFTRHKLSGLRDDAPQCRALLHRAGLETTAVPAFGSDQCRVTTATRLAAGQDMLALLPTDVAPACTVMAATALWTWQVVQPAAQQILGASVVRIEHLGSYSCRRMYGRGEGAWSEHATANALDIAGFVLSDGRRISVLRDWDGEGEEAAFLRTVRDGACRVFSTVLSPDYNRQHADHFHFDQADRGGVSWGVCR
ncbi:extensin family protein [Sphingobium sp. B11D3A]|uniref:extensin-like domain-containing protein n=1 Tax=Sphingobium sp. B11D3A TaxID=2940574 RepID=UPI0022246A31|nr:extensin family protein [Sphingobium sp. B11D3A]MCW2390414.1 hypothetical protein [Sphingobium sp. B11D3A]